ncbi:uncharacterized protein LOC142983627 [Anticarsia gemmatalis]|uniref:uncharacterized protein LOC142983627 n=1 Tax=Anticarsia gemmatalis TaxID=129554 RepID=UPI003F767EAB
MIILALCLLLSIQISASIKLTPGVPVPGAALLEEIFTRHLKTEGTVWNFVTRRNMEPNNTESFYADDNLDLSVLDLGNVRKLISIAKKKYQDEARKKAYSDFRRRIRYLPTKPGENAHTIRTAGFKDHPRWDPYFFLPLIDREREIIKCFEMMKQSIYASQFRLEESRKFRVKFSDNPSYKIALLYGACTHNIRKIESLYHQAKRFPVRTHYVWYLIVYERMLVVNVDINDAAERMFMIHGEWLKTRRVRRVKTTRPPIDFDKSPPPMPPKAG